MKNSIFYRLIIPLALVAVALGIISYQHIANSKDILADTVINRPIVIELFTSQGCTNCPPADELLGKIKDRDNVIALSYHVDYWDRLGWVDRFSSASYSDYQRKYSRKFSSDLYTPQMIINGTEEFNGANTRLLNANLKSYSLVDSLEVPTVFRRNNQIFFDYTLPQLSDNYTAFALLVLDDYKVKPSAGENKNRTLKNANVVMRKVALDMNKNSGRLSFAKPSGVNNRHKFKVALIIQDEDFNVTHATISSSY